VKVPDITNALTVDVEDYFHVSAFADVIKPDSWASLESRVERNMATLMELFDAESVSATFFVLGWVAERFPQLVKEIVANGHEIACHGYSHQLIYNQEESTFREETVKAKKLLEDISGNVVSGYRAASYSITERSRWALEILIDAGFEYDSSIVPTHHDLYGIPGASEHPHRLMLDDGRFIIEFPPSTIKVMGRRVPIGGGGYFRLFPYWFTRNGLRSINEIEQKPFTFYLHPWEIDPQQPRVAANWKSRFRHYNNLHKCEARLRQLLKQFKFSTKRSVISGLELPSVDIGKCLHTGDCNHLRSE